MEQKIILHFLNIDCCLQIILLWYNKLWARFELRRFGEARTWPSLLYCSSKAISLCKQSWNQPDPFYLPHKTEQSTHKKKWTVQISRTLELGLWDTTETRRGAAELHHPFCRDVHLSWAFALLHVTTGYKQETNKTSVPPDCLLHINK